MAGGGVGGGQEVVRPGARFRRLDRAGNRGGTRLRRAAALRSGRSAGSAAGLPPRRAAALAGARSGSRGRAPFVWGRAPGGASGDGGSRSGRYGGAETALADGNGAPAVPPRNSREALDAGD